MKPLSLENIISKRNLIYNLILKKFNISDMMLSNDNYKELYSNISNNDFIIKIIQRI